MDNLIVKNGNEKLFEISGQNLNIEMSDEKLNTNNLNVEMSDEKLINTDEKLFINKLNRNNKILTENVDELVANFLTLKVEYDFLHRDYHTFKKSVENTLCYISLILVCNLAYIFLK